MSKETKTQNLISGAQIDETNILDSMFSNDRDRIKFNTHAFANMSIAKAFAKTYGYKLSDEIKKDQTMNTVTNIELGQIYLGEVKQLDKNVLTLTIPGVKEELICKENFNSCIDNLRNYLMTHNNQLMFEAREKKPGAFIVSVTNGYFRYWMKQIENDIQKEVPIDVHIDEVVKGGFMAHVNIDPLVAITGKEYVNSVFIPGSQIVLNIEKDFEKWVGQDVEIIPQKVVDFKHDYTTGCIEKSIVGSRKRLLQLDGYQNLYELWYKDHLAKHNDNVTYERPVLDGHVTGIINSAKKQGVFVELDGKNITGLMPMDPSKLLDYHPGDPITVKIKEFEIQEGKDAFKTTRKGKVIQCNTRPVFELA